MDQKKQTIDEREKPLLQQFKEVVLGYDPGDKAVSAEGNLTADYVNSPLYNTLPTGVRTTGRSAATGGPKLDGSVPTGSDPSRAPEGPGDKGKGDEVEKKGWKSLVDPTDLLLGDFD
ncbi:hypothetical protein HK104_003354 [Borealophlyctis nickersoniae]|nr:hypothetical protein HK104_003354 [Borealophlyctis nickersoniae]